MMVGMSANLADIEWLLTAQTIARKGVIRFGLQAPHV
jgi:hypothetical protein